MGFLSRLLLLNGFSKPVVKYHSNILNRHTIFFFINPHNLPNYALWYYP